MAPKSLEIDQDNLPTKFSAVNADFNSLSLNPLGSRISVHVGIKEQYCLSNSSFYRCWLV